MNRRLGGGLPVLAEFNALIDGGKDRAPGTSIKNGPIWSK
jgi:hypothetical protein